MKGSEVAGAEQGFRAVFLSAPVSRSLRSAFPREVCYSTGLSRLFSGTSSNRVSFPFRQVGARICPGSRGRRGRRGRWRVPSWVCARTCRSWTRRRAQVSASCQAGRRHGAAPQDTRGVPLSSFPAEPRGGVRTPFLRAPSRTDPREDPTPAPPRPRRPAQAEVAPAGRWPGALRLGGHLRRPAWGKRPAGDAPPGGGSGRGRGREGGAPGGRGRAGRAPAPGGRGGGRVFPGAFPASPSDSLGQGNSRGPPRTPKPPRTQVRNPARPRPPAASVGFESPSEPGPARAAAGLRRSPPPRRRGLPGGAASGIALVPASPRSRPRAPARPGLQVPALPAPASRAPRPQPFGLGPELPAPAFPASRPAIPDSAPRHVAQLQWGRNTFVFHVFVGK